jgi:glutamate-1-semialdehyde 2,1-aminomutase
MKTNQLTTASAAIFERARLHTPGGINSFSRATDPPLVFKRAEGAYLYDVDGNKYIDYHAAFGPTILGHCYPSVTRAVAESMSQIDLVGIGTTELELAVAEKIAEHVPSAEMVHLCNTGTEATYNAVRLARAVTGRKKLLKFQGCFHGSHDYLCMNIISPPSKIGKSDPGSAGMLPEAVVNTLVAEFNNLYDVERILEREAENLAAIILEPIQHNVGCVLPQQEFLEGLRKITDENGIILIFDEVITGFRHGLGGYQAKCGVTPDLTTLAKSMANGFPCAALCGKKELMERFSTVGGDVIFAGTYNGHPIGTAAALATIEELEKGWVYGHIFGLGEQIRKDVTEAIDEIGVKAFVAGYGSIFVVYFMDPPVNSYTDLLRNNQVADRMFRSYLINHGILTNPIPLKRNHISASHTESNIQETLEVIRRGLTEVKERQR